MIQDIYSYAGLQKINDKFESYLDSCHIEEDIINKSIALEQFIAEIFSIKTHIDRVQDKSRIENTIAEFKKKFIQKRAIKKYSNNNISKLKPHTKFADMGIYDFANYILTLLKDEINHLEELDEAMQYVAYKVYVDPDNAVFILPKKLDFDNLVYIGNQYVKKEGLSQANYCIYCHNHEKDYCRKGNERYSGCPLEQKISEMNYLYSKGHIIAALAVAMIDNPLIAATGYRVCNDCMKSCVYQKQEAVDIPSIESDMLNLILALPYGAEIYYLLTRWNPLANFIIKDDVLGNILVLGLGPAGFSMSYYLLRSGHKVTAIDRMNISKLDSKFFLPIENWQNLVGTYMPQGFGGVSEYGITDRWNKNNLLLIRMILERFNHFEIKSNLKFGVDIRLKKSIEDYDYIALCLGAGRPYLPKIKNIDAKGIWSAFSYLMQANCYPNNFSSYLLSPIIVVGAGLTAIDCAMISTKYSKNVNILYRKSLKESPSYRENHEELQIAIDYGIKFIENTNLESIEIDENHRIKSINNNIPVRTLIFAFGTYYNDEIFLKEVDIMKRHKEKIGIFGDLDLQYSGSVVKAIASSKNGYKRISEYLSSVTPKTS